MTPRSTAASSVIPGTGAERAGLQAGDVLLRIGGVRVGGHAEAIATIGLHPEGEEVEFQIRRGGRDLSLKARLGRRSEADR